MFAGVKLCLLLLVLGFTFPHVLCLQEFSCACYVGYSGSRCEIDVDECLSSPCQNEAECVERSTRPDVNVEDAAGYECVCLPGFEGGYK